MTKWDGVWLAGVDVMRIRHHNTCPPLFLWLVHNIDGISPEQLILLKIKQINGGKPNNALYKVGIEAINGLLAIWEFQVVGRWKYPNISHVRVAAYSRTVTYMRHMGGIRAPHTPHHAHSLFLLSLFRVSSHVVCFGGPAHWVLRDIACCMTSVTGIWHIPSLQPPIIVSCIFADFKCSS